MAIPHSPVTFPPYLPCLPHATHSHTRHMQHSLHVLLARWAKCFWKCFFVWLKNLQNDEAVSFFCSTSCICYMNSYIVLQFRLLLWYFWATARYLCLSKAWFWYFLCIFWLIQLWTGTKGSFGLPNVLYTCRLFSSWNFALLVIFYGVELIY